MKLDEYDAQIVYEYLQNWLVNTVANKRSVDNRELAHRIQELRGTANE